MLLTPDIKIFLGGAATCIALISYVPYFRDIFAGKTKPHAFSWLIWALLTGIGFAGQAADNGGPGSWVSAVTAVLCFSVFLLALSRGEKNITRSDWWCLTVSLATIPLWIVTSTPLWSMILVTIIDTIGFIPTFRKSFIHPFEETAVTYTLSSFKFFVSLLALTNYSIVTVLYPASLVLANGLFVVMVYIRRTQLSGQGV
jgi:hypothetical protein